MRQRSPWTPAIVLLLGCAALSRGFGVVAQMPSASSLEAPAQLPFGLFQACYENVAAMPTSICLPCILSGHVQVAPIKASGYTVEECATLVAARSRGDGRNVVPSMVTVFTLSNNNTVCASAVGLARKFQLEHKAMVAGTEATCPPATGLKVYKFTFMTGAQKAAFLQGYPAAQLTSNSTAGGRRMLSRVGI